MGKWLGHGQKTIVAIAVVLGATTTSQADDITFYADVLPVLQENCQFCHRDNGANLGGMVAPMSFETYSGTRPWAKAIAKAVDTHAMPPWHASPDQTGLFENERTLTPTEIETLVTWVKTGAKRGNPKDATENPVWSDSTDWTIGEPDLVVQPDEAYFVDDDVEDAYVYLETRMTKKLLPTDRFIKAVEFKPGSPVVHHIITFPLGGIAPGNEAVVYPDGIGALFKKGTDLTWEMHYHKEPGPGTGVWDRSSAAIQFYDNDDDVKFQMQGADLGTYDFVIPAGDPSFSLQEEYIFKHPSRIVSLLPHFHLRGSAAKYEAYYPDGSHEVLLDIPRYDFNWQTTYSFKKFKNVPEGTRVVFTATWDNSADNPYNPDPTVDVFYGEPTTDEMSYGYISFINDSDDHESFFDNLTGESGEIDLVALVYAYDDDHDRALQKSEVPEEFRPYFAFIDANKDGEIRPAEAEAAMERFNAGMSGSE